MRKVNTLVILLNSALIFANFTHHKVVALIIVCFDLPIAMLALVIAYRTLKRRRV
jgi:hypothetical protein